MKSFYSRFAFATLLCSGLFLINHNARAQLACNCITASHSISNLCNSCHDSIVYHGLPPHQIADTFLVCDTCWTFALTNTCSYGIEALQIYDSISGGGVKTLAYGCAVVQQASEDTSWTSTNDSDGSIMFQDTGNACWEPGAQLLVSICTPLKEGDTIFLGWWSCEFPYPEFLSPLCPWLETVIVP